MMGQKNQQPKPKKKGDAPPLVYLYIYKKMIEKFGKSNNLVPAKKLIEITRRTVYQIPKRYDYFILGEMQEYCLLQKINTQKYMLFGANADKKLKKLNEFWLW
jgi:hypothetical protein